MHTYGAGVRILYENDRGAQHSSSCGADSHRGFSCTAVLSPTNLRWRGEESPCRKQALFGKRSLIYHTFWLVGRGIAGARHDRWLV